MKKIFAMIGVCGLGAMTSFAQTTNKENCPCAKKAVHHSTCSHKVAVHKKVTKKTYAYRYPGRLQPMALTGSNGCFINTDGDIEYTNSQSFTGNYPSDITCDLDELLVPQFKSLIVTSSAFKNKGVLPAKYTCQGEQMSPPINVANVPQGTVALAIVMFDPNATAKSSSTYWLMWNLDPNGVIPENFISDHEAESPVSKQYGYQAVCPASGTHYYHFRVYALDSKLLLDKHATKAAMERAMQGHVLAKGELIGEYNRHLD